MRQILHPALISTVEWLPSREAFSMEHRTKTTIVESFSLSLEGFPDILRREAPVSRIEEALIAHLEAPNRLLRWAVVRVAEDGCFWVEGAYLKESR
jgi:hypothetical protein